MLLQLLRSGYNLAPIGPHSPSVPGQQGKMYHTTWVHRQLAPREIQECLQ